MKAEKYVKKRIKEIHKAGFDYRFGSYEWRRSSLLKATNDPNEPIPGDIVLVQPSDFDGLYRAPVLALLLPPNQYGSHNLIGAYDNGLLEVSHWSALPNLPRSQRNSGLWTSVGVSMPKPDGQSWVLALNDKKEIVIVMPEETSSGEVVFTHYVSVVDNTTNGLMFGEYPFDATYWVQLPEKVAK